MLSRADPERNCVAPVAERSVAFAETLVAKWLQCRVVEALRSCDVADTNRAVSYTHLDVYKRQLKSCRPGCQHEPEHDDDRNGDDQCGDRVASDPAAERIAAHRPRDSAVIAESRGHQPPPLLPEATQTEGPGHAR